MVATLTGTIAFVRSTLAEVSRSDLHLHVVDAAAPDAPNPLAIVHTVLGEIRARDVPELLLMNNTEMAPRDRSTASRRACPHALPVPPPTGAGFEERGRP